MYAQPMDTNNRVVKAKGGVASWVELGKGGEKGGHLKQCQWDH